VNPIDLKRLEADRKKGTAIEIDFCKLMQSFNCFTYRFQKGYDKVAVLEKDSEYIILPDIWVIPPDDEDFFCEVKSKYPSRHGAYGLEEYRVSSLLKIVTITKKKVLYVIYDTTDKTWYWQNLSTLENMAYRRFWSQTYVDGSVKRLPVHYYQKKWFNPIKGNGKLIIPK